MLVMDRCVFIHIPKTGGSWVGEALRRSTNVLATVNRHPTVKEVKTPLFKFAFVRHPLSWYISFWGYRQRTGWRYDDVGIDWCGSDDLNRFLYNCLRRCPAYYSRMVDSRIGHSVDFVGKQETLVDDLIEALNRAKQPFDESILRQTPKINVSAEYGEIDLDIARELIMTENGITTRFNYTQDPEEVLNGK